MKKRTGLYKGQSLVIVTLVLTVVLGALALVFDVGVVYFNWVAITTGTDAASLAGANYLPSQPDQAKSTANAYALQNGIQQSEIQSIQVDPTDNKKLTVTVVRVVPSYFLAALSFVEASAFATVSAQSQLNRMASVSAPPPKARSSRHRPPVARCRSGLTQLLLTPTAR